MKVDISKELRDFVYITNVYKLISTYNLKGHQIGRKIGDMLEILTMGAIYQDNELVKRIKTEGKLVGYTTAGHKVEFGFFSDLDDEDSLFGAVECKCVGVEETTAGKGTSYIKSLTVGSNLDFVISSRWLSERITLKIKLESLNPDFAIFSFYKNGIELSRFQVAKSENFKIIVDENEKLIISKPNADLLTDVPGIIRYLTTIKLHSLSADKCSIAFYNCLTGPQTIEKAKQASLVSMDLRRKVDGFWGKEEIAEEQKKFLFINVICEFSHWEDKSRNVVKTCIDHNLIVADEIIIRAFQLFEEKFGDKMLDKISKAEFMNDSAVKDAVQKVIEEYEFSIFYDLEIEKMVKIGYSSGKLKVTEI